MKSKIVLSLTLGLLTTSFAVAGGGIPFEFTADGGAIPAMDPGGLNAGVSVFPLTMRDQQFPDGIPYIESLELQLTDLTHTFPDDLDIYLIDPFGRTVEVMTDRGDGMTLTGVTLIFNDNPANEVPPDELRILSGTYRPEGTEPGHGGGLNNFVGGSGGTDAWILLIIDDAEDDSGFLASWTLRGTTPEPVTLSLLALGALMFLRRRRA